MLVILRIYWELKGNNNLQCFGESVITLIKLKYILNMLNLIVGGSEIRTTLMFVPPSLPLFLSYCSNQFMLHFFFLLMIFIDSCRIRVKHKCAVCFISRIYLLLFLEVLLKWIT